MSTDSTGHDFLRSKEAFDKHRKAQEAVRAATAAKDRAQDLWMLTVEVEVILGGALHEAQRRGADPEEISTRQEQLAKYEREAAELKDEMGRTAAEERKPSRSWQRLPRH